VSLEPPLTWDEIITALRGGADIIRATEQDVAVIWDATLMSMMPPVSNPLTQLREFAASRPQNVKAFIFVGGSTMGRQVVSILERALFLRWIKTARTLEEGYRLAQERLDAQT
jgi:hypothetical protein